MTTFSTGSYQGGDRPNKGFGSNYKGSAQDNHKNSGKPGDGAKIDYNDLKNKPKQTTNTGTVSLTKDFVLGENIDAEHAVFVKPDGLLYSTGIDYNTDQFSSAIYGIYSVGNELYALGNCTFNGNLVTGFSKFSKVFELDSTYSSLDPYGTGIEHILQSQSSGEGLVFTGDEILSLVIDYSESSIEKLKVNSLDKTLTKTIRPLGGHIEYAGRSVALNGVGKNSSNYILSGTFHHTSNSNQDRILELYENDGTFSGDFISKFPDGALNGIASYGRKVLVNSDDSFHFCFFKASGTNQGTNIRKYNGSLSNVGSGNIVINQDADFGFLRDSNGLIVVFQTYGTPSGSGTVNGQAFGGVFRINPDNSLDSTFTKSIQFNGQINDVKEGIDGKYYVCGDFTVYGTTSVNKLCRLNYNGTLDTTFNYSNNFNITSSINSLVIQDDKIIVVGDFRTVNGIKNQKVAVLDLNGNLQKGFKEIDSRELSIGVLKDAGLTGETKTVTLQGGILDTTGKTSGNIVCIETDGTLTETINKYKIGRNLSDTQTQVTKNP